ncbi:minor tail protein [Mycobacterium phage DuncansLeg]|nr:minor tail protein [Mycobacterium phage DuncansLeg]
MTDFLKIELKGRDGSLWNLSGPGMGAQGVTLSPGALENFYDAPVKTLYVPGPFGEEYAGKRAQRREIVFTVQAFDGEPETWSTIDSKWRWAWDYDEESEIRVTTADGTRYLKVRLMEAPKPYYEKDPHITADNPIVMTVTATFPYWRETAKEYKWSTLQTQDMTTFDIFNYGDVPIFLRWFVTAPGLWILPDFSWGNDMYSRGLEDQGRTIPLPELVENEHCSVDSDPRVQTIIAVNGSPVQHRWKGNDLLYPLMPGKGGKVPVRLKNAPQGGAIKLTQERWHSRPWSRPGVLPNG